MHKGKLTWLPEPLRLWILKKPVKKLYIQLTSKQKELDASRAFCSLNYLIHSGIPVKEADEIIMSLALASGRYSTARMRARKLLDAQTIGNVQFHIDAIRTDATEAVKLTEKTRKQLSRYYITL